MSETEALLAMLQDRGAYAPGTVRAVRAPQQPAQRTVGAAGPEYEVPEALRAFARKELAAGTGRAQLFRTMLEQGHALEHATAALDGFRPKLKLDALRDASLRQPGPTPLSLHFAFANVDLVGSPAAERVPDLRLQLYRRPDLFDEATCRETIERLKAHFAPSTVVKQELTGLETHRTSATVYLSAIDAALNERLKARIAAELGVDARYLEELQVQRYRPGQHYKPHADYFHIDNGDDAEPFGPMGQRTWTCIVYLNDDFEGGETWFTDADRVVEPERGLAIFWNNLTPLGRPNPATLHCGMPVVEGTKYIVTAWFREAPASAPSRVSQRFRDEFRGAVRTPSDIHLHLERLHELASSVERVTELGVRRGVSTRAFLAADVRLRAYDLELDDGLGELFELAREEGRDVRYERADVLELELEPTDLLFIDTFHCYEQLIQELRLHADACRRYLVLHDTQTFGTVSEQFEIDPGEEVLADVRRVRVGSNGLLPALIHFLIEKPGEWTFVEHRTYNNGLTVLERIAPPAD